jgi:hypothetical protein
MEAHDGLIEFRDGDQTTIALRFPLLPGPHRISEGV